MLKKSNDQQIGWQLKREHLLTFLDSYHCMKTSIDNRIHSQNHRIVEIGIDFLSSCSITSFLKHDQLDCVAQDGGLVEFSVLPRM